MFENRLTEKGDHIVYANEFPKYREQIRLGIKSGKLKCWVDYNRSGWATDQPQSSIIYRVKVR